MADSGLTDVSLKDDVSQQLPKIIRCKTEKTFLLLPFTYKR
jgi:hypothetical protein